VVVDKSLLQLFLLLQRKKAPEFSGALCVSTFFKRLDLSAAVGAFFLV
jgi:hypothetical protein